MSSLVLDTHAAVWSLVDRSRLSVGVASGHSMPLAASAFGFGLSERTTDH